jgi:hypothetical protein
VQKYNIENQWLETSLDDLPHSQVRRSTESDRGESGSSLSRHLATFKGLDNLLLRYKIAEMVSTIGFCR